MAYIGHSPSTGEDNNFKILDTISSYTLTFDGSSSSVVSASDDTIYFYNHRFITGQRVTYNDGGGSAIGGLADGVYFIIKQDQNNIKLATSADNAVSGTAVNLTDVGAGSSHTLNVAFDGVNTKFKATHTSGKKAKITRASQLVLSVNGVIQQPHDSSSPSTGFGIESGSIVFSQAPQSTDVFWGHILTSNNVTFDISDNKVDHFSGDGSTTTFTLSKTPANNENVLVTIDGVVQYPNDTGSVRSYNVVLNVITFATAPGSGTQIEVRHIGFAGSTSGGVTGFYGRSGNAVLKSTDNITVNDAAVTGDLTITGDLTVNGTTTTLDTNLIGVDKIEVVTESTNIAVAVTHNGTGDLIRLYDGASQVVTVDDEGNVGIGSVTPTEKLDVHGVGIITGGIITNVSPAITIRDGTTVKGYIGFYANDPFIGRKNGVGLLFQDNKVRPVDGDTGIGTNNTVSLGEPTYKFKDLYLEGDIHIDSDVGQLRIGADEDLKIDHNGSNAYFMNGTGSTLHRAEDHIFENADGSTEYVRIEDGGNVGIGTNNPDTLLHLESSNPAIRITDDNQTADNKTWLLTAGNTQLLRIQALNDADSGGGQLFDFYRNGNNVEEFRGMKGGSAWFTINNDDERVGIGTNEPLTELHVRGETFTDITVQSDRTSGNIGGLNFRKGGGSTGILTAQYIVNTSGSHFFHAQGSSKFDIGSDGNIKIPTGGALGINGASPQSSLDVIANSSSYAVDIRGRSSDDISEIHFCGYDSAPNYAVIGVTTEGGGRLKVSTNGTDGLRLTGDAKVKINVPNSKVGVTTGGLDVWGDATSYPIIRLGSLEHNEEGELIRFGRTDISSDIRYHSIFGRHSSTTSNNYLAFKLHDGSGSPYQAQKEVFTLTGSVKIGINQSSPDAL